MRKRFLMGIMAAIMTLSLVPQAASADEITNTGAENVIEVEADQTEGSTAENTDADVVQNTSETTEAETVAAEAEGTAAETEADNTADGTEEISVEDGSSDVENAEVGLSAEEAEPAAEDSEEETAPEIQVAESAEETDELSGKCGENLTWKLDNDGTLTISGTGEMYYYGVEETPWYSVRTNIKKVVIAKGVTEVGAYAFFACSNLTSVTIPGSVSSIGEWAFANCDSLTGVTIPDSVTRIGEYAFYNCISLKSVTMSKNITEIPEGLFMTCQSLTDITIPAGVTAIGGWAFANCDMTGITIPAGVTSIGKEAFFYCTKLTSLSIPASVTSIGEGAFCGGFQLESIKVDGNNQVYNSNGNCNAIIETASRKLIVGCQNTIIPAGVTSIGENAFMGCPMTGITIPDSVTSIETAAFNNCYNLTDIVIPDSVTYIGESAFGWCKSLTKITIPASVTSIEGYTFYRCEALTDVTIPASVTGIGACAFLECSSLKNITIPNSVTDIGSNAIGMLEGDEIGSYVPVEGVTVNCGKCTAAYVYAVNNGFSYNVVFETGNCHTKVVDLEAVAATCTEGGKTEESHCSVCGAVIQEQEVVPAAGHSFGNWTVTEEATCKTAGTQTRTCFVCGETETQSIAKLPAHTAVTIPAVAPTYTKTGLTAGTKCSVCGEVLKAQTTVAKKVLAAPVISTLYNVSNGVKVSWKKVTGATGYYVYRGSKKIATIASGSILTYTDTAAKSNGTKYTYKVVAYRKESGAVATSKASAVKSCYFLTRPAISALKSYSARTMKVNWTRNSKATGYQIKYVVGSTTKTVTVKGAASLTKTIRNLKRGKTYKVSVRAYKAVSGVNYYSTWSTVKSVKIK